MTISRDSPYIPNHTEAMSLTQQAKQRGNEMDIDTICQMTRNPELLNALHACRPGHPLKTAHSWYQAFFLAAQRPSHEISLEAVNWLKAKSYEIGA